MQQQRHHLHNPMVAYPPHVYYSSSAPAVAGPSHRSFHPSVPHASTSRSPSAAFLPAAQAWAELHPTNCCDICCPGLSSCAPFLGQCQCCDRSCLPCCQTCWGCMPGGTCSATGSCPTFCSGYVGGWGASLLLQWLSFVLLVVTVPLRQWFWGGSSPTVQVGLWTTTNFYTRLLDDSTLERITNIHTFKALRAFTILSVVFTLSSAILAAVRLYRQQRRRFISRQLEWSTCAMAVTSLVCVVVAMALGTAVVVNLKFASVGSLWNPGDGLRLLYTASAMMLIATPLHIITTVQYHRAKSRASEDSSGVPAALLEQQQPQQQHEYRSEGQVAPRDGDVSSNSNVNLSHNDAGPSTTTTIAASSSYFSHPSAYQPPTRSSSDTAQYQVYLSGVAAAPVDMKPQW